MNLKRSLRNLINPYILRLLPPHVVFDQNRNDRTGALFKAWGHVVTSHMMDGAYYEFGVYKGESFRESYRIYHGYVDWMDAQASSPEKWRRKIAWTYNHHFYAFDTFAGMPKNTEDAHLFKEGAFESSLDEVKAAGEKVGMFEGERICYFQGLFAELAKNRSGAIEMLKPAVIANIDCDLYESCVDALKILGPKLQQGTVLMMDDWNIFCADRNRGERRALREFLEEHPDIEVEAYFSYSHAGQAFVVHRDSPVG